MSKPEKYSFYSNALDRRRLGVTDFYINAKHYGCLQLIDDYLQHPEKYVRNFSVTINGKKRQIVTYQPSTNGAKLRHIHRLFAILLKEIYHSSEYSYAYKKGCGVQQCLDRHLLNDFFLKTDIHSYFESISFEKMMARLCGYSRTFSKRHGYWNRILQLCFYQGHMPIGFVSSPVLSDLFLNETDQRMGKMEEITYTRYADDFIISATGDNAQKKLESALSVLQSEMDACGLELNKKKTYFRHLRQAGDAIHVLGLNLVRTEEGNNRLTVSDSYIRETCKELCGLIQDKPYLEEWEARKRFCTVMGKIAYIMHASEKSAQKLKRMIFVKSGQDLNLDYRSLVTACVNHPERIVEYQNKQYKDAYIKAFLHRNLPADGTSMERLFIPGTTEYEKNMPNSQEGKTRLYADTQKDDKVVMDETNKISKSAEYKEASTRITLGRLKYYIMHLCRVLENPEGCKLTPHRIRLTIGNKTMIISSAKEAPQLYEFAKELRTAKEKVQFFAEYDYDNLDAGKLVKSGRVHMKPNGWRPLLCYASSGGADCVVYSKNREHWLMQKCNGLQDEYTLVNTDSTVFMARTCWWVSLKMQASWPLHTSTENQRELRGIVEEIYSQIQVTLPEDFVRTISIDNMITINGQTALILVQKINELFVLLKQTEGIFALKCYLIPADYFDAHDERPLELVQLHAHNDGRIQILKSEY